MQTGTPIQTVDGATEPSNVVRKCTTCLAILTLIVAMLGGCGSGSSHSGYLGRDSGSAVFVQWTRAGNTVVGEVSMAMPMDGSLHTMSVPFTGAISGPKVSLNLQTGLSGGSSRLSGTLSASHLNLTGDTGLGDLRAATRAAYDAAVVALVPQVSQAELSQQQELAREAAVKEGLHSIQIGIQSYAIDNNDTYPAEATKASLVDSSGQPYVSIWPTNPFTGAPMAPGTDPGDYSYTCTDNTFQLVGYGSDGTAVITLP